MTLNLLMLLLYMLVVIIDITQCIEENDCVNGDGDYNASKQNMVCKDLLEANNFPHFDPTCC